MSLNFDDYDSILSSLNAANSSANDGSHQQQQQQQLKDYFDDTNNINNSNSLFVGFNPITSVNLNQLDMNGNLQNESSSNSTYNSLSPSYPNSESSPEAILFGDNYKQSMIKQEQGFDFNRQSFDQNMDVDELLSNDFNFQSSATSSSNQFDLPLLIESSNSSPDSFNSSPESVVTYQPQLTEVKGKRGRKPTVKSETMSPPTLSKTNSSSSGVTKPGKKVKSSHNLIEKKYRTNINSKIIELRNCVPALRILISKNHNLHNGQLSSNNDAETGEFEDDYEGEGYTDDERKLDGLKPAKKLNKATILSKATEYIRHLEYKLEVMSLENDKLREIVINTTGVEPSQHTQQNSPQSMSDSPPAPQQQQQQQQQQGQQSRSSLTNNLIMGGLTCLVGASTLDDFDSNNGNFRRSLFSIPIFSFGSNQSSSVMFKPLFGLMKIIMVFGVLTYMLEPFFKPAPKDDKKNQLKFEWVSLLKYLQYLTNPKLIIDDFVVINEQQAFQPLLVSSADLQMSTLIPNYLRLILKPNNCNLLLLKAIYLRIIVSQSPILKFLSSKFCERYWNKASKESTDDKTVKVLLENYSEIWKDDIIFNRYIEVLNNKDESFIKYSTPFEILSNLSIEKNFQKTLQTIIEFENLVKSELDQEEIKSMKNTISQDLNNCIKLSETLPSKNVELYFLKSLIEPTMINIKESLNLAKMASVNSNSLICGIIKLQILSNDFDKSKLLLLFKKLNLSEIDLLSFTSLYSVINIFPMNLLEDDETSSTLSDSSIEYRENYSIEFKLNKLFCLILGNLRIFIGNKENFVGLNNDLKSKIVDEFVNEINQLDC